MKTQRKLVSPWEYTYDEFKHDMLFHPIGEPWHPNLTNPLSRPLTAFSKPSHALSYLNGKAGHMLLIDPPYDFFGRKGVFEKHPEHDFQMVGLSREPIAKFKDRIAAIAVAKEENPDIKELLPDETPIKKWHFTQVVKAFMSRRHVPLRVMMNYATPLARWASKQKIRNGDAYLRLPHTISRRQHGRDSRRDNKAFRLSAAMDESYFMGEFDQEKQAYVFANAEQIQRELEAMRENNDLMAINALMIDENKQLIYSKQVVNRFHQEMDREKRLLAMNRPTPFSRP